MVDKKAQGKKNREKGAAFELKVRKDLEKKGWIVDKWSNNVSDYPEGNINLPPEEREDRKLIPAKRKFNPFKKVLGIGTGFPDFVILHPLKHLKTISGETYYKVFGVEVKSNGYIDPEEREKCKWLLENNIFARVVIAKKGKKRGEIIYEDFNQKGGVK